MNVLVLDDEKEIADLVEVYLQNENYKINQENIRKIICSYIEI